MGQVADQREPAVDDRVLLQLGVGQIAERLGREEQRWQVVAELGEVTLDRASARRAGRPDHLRRYADRQRDAPHVRVRPACPGRGNGIGRGSQAEGQPLGSQRGPRGVRNQPRGPHRWMVPHLVQAPVGCVMLRNPAAELVGRTVPPLQFGFLHRVSIEETSVRQSKPFRRARGGRQMSARPAGTTSGTRDEPCGGPSRACRPDGRSGRDGW